MRKTYYVVIDFETEGLNTFIHNPLQIGAVLMDVDGNILKAPFMRYIKWLFYDITPEAQSVHGLDKTFLDEHGEFISKVEQDFIAWLSPLPKEEASYVMMGQNNAFENAIIQKWFPKLASLLSRRSFDTQTMTMTFFPGERVKLSIAADRLGITQPEPHDAVSDCLVCVKLYNEYRKFIDYDALNERLRSGNNMT